METTPAQGARFGEFLRHWRRTRGMSQLQLAERVGLSARHLSFLETGRCGASRGTILQLGRALELEAVEIQRLLLVAGHAGDWSRGHRSDTGVREALRGLRHMLLAHDPFPAILSDPRWRVASGNRGALAFFARLRALNPALRWDPVDLLQLLPDPQGLGRIVRGFDELLRAVLAGLYELEPDPATFGHARTLLRVLPRDDADGPCVAIGRAARETPWSHELCLCDGGADIPLRLLSLPFAGAACGFALVLVQPTEESREAGEAYFDRLIRQSRLTK